METRVEKAETENEKDEDEDSGFSLFKKKRSFSSAPKAESLPVASRETQCPIDERERCVVVSNSARDWLNMPKRISYPLVSIYRTICE